MRPEPTDQRFVITRALLPGYVASAVGYGPEQPGTAGPGTDGGAEPHPEQPIHRGVPSPYLTFIVSLADPVVTGDSIDEALGERARRTDVVLGGLARRPTYVRPDADQRGIQLAVQPLAARAVFGVSTRELLEVVDGADVLGPEVDRLRGRLIESGGWARRFDLVADFLTSRIERRPAERVRPEIAEAWRWLAWHRGTGSIEGLARHVALSRRQLTTLFSREVGASPKQVGRLMRFDHAKQRLGHAVRTGASLDLTRLASACGYYDHAHLDRDFAQYVGTSPTGWLAEERRNIQAHGHRNGEDWSHDRHHEPGPAGLGHPAGP